MDARRGSRSWGDHPIVVIIGILAGLAAITAFVLQLIGSDDDDPAPTGDVTTTVPQPDPSESATSDPSPSAEETTTTPPSGVDLELALQTNTCSVVPGGGLDGGDVMTLLFRTVSVGDVAYDGTVVAMAHSDSGLQGQSTDGMSSGSASSFVQVEFAGQDYGRTHEFTVEIEPAEGVADVELSNNEATITVVLPPVRNTATFDPCS